LDAHSRVSVRELAGIMSRGGNPLVLDVRSACIAAPTGGDSWRVCGGSGRTLNKVVYGDPPLRFKEEPLFCGGGVDLEYPLYELGLAGPRDTALASDAELGRKLRSGGHSLFGSFHSVGRVHYAEI
jgi:hypothetical protein